MTVQVVLEKGVETVVWLLPLLQVSLKVNSNSGFRAAALTLGGAVWAHVLTLPVILTLNSKFVPYANCFLSLIHGASTCDGTNGGKQTCTAPWCWSEFGALVGALTTTPTTTTTLETKVEGFQKSPCFPFLSLPSLIIWNDPRASFLLFYINLSITIADFNFSQFSYKKGSK